MKTARKRSAPRGDPGAIVTVSPRDYDAILFDLDGVAAFLAARSIELPVGTPEDGLEIARFWSSTATFSGERGRYEIRGGDRPRVPYARRRLACAVSVRHCAESHSTAHGIASCLPPSSVNLSNS
jgi:hypothetical protein